MVAVFVDSQHGRSPLGWQASSAALGILALCVYIHMVTSREILAALEAAGWRRVGQKGSHVQLKHPDRPGRVTVPHPRKDVQLVTLRSIERQSGVTIRK